MSEYTRLPEIGKNLGYEWEPIDVGIALASLLEYFKRNHARAFWVDVYASNERMYRNIVIQLPHENSVFTAENIEIMFERDSGRQLTLTRTP